MFNRLSGFLGALCVSVLCLAVEARAGTVLVRAGDDLQAALNAARPGDVLLLEAGATFTGNFVLPVKAGSDFITVRSSGPDAPAAGARISPADAVRLAKIRSSNTMSALRTAPGAHHWRLVLLEFPATREGYNDIIQLGDGSSAQTQLAQVPYELELDRLYIHGDPLMGQKRGIALNARSVVIRNCYISDIRAVGMDTQAIGGWNGPGPFTIENNYLEAAGENFMLGGADPYIPNLVSEGVVFRQNHVSRPMSWRDPVVAAPSGVATVVRAGGALAQGAHRYQVVARRRVGSGIIARSAATPEVTATAAGGAAVTIRWNAVPNATEYYVYGTSPLGVSQFWSVTEPTFTDTGAAGRSGSAPTSAGNMWTVKNLFELKNARNVLVAGNVFENHWAGAQSGYAILFTPRNQNGGCRWCVVEQVTFRGNILRNAAGGFNILGTDDLAPSQQTNNIRITGNLVTLRRSLGGSAWFLLMGNGPRDITVDHNTIDSDGTTVTYVYGGAAGGVLAVSRFQFTRNAARHMDYGMNGAGVGWGNGVITAYFSDGVITENWLQGGMASRYPSRNYFDGTFASAFTNAAGGDYTTAAAGPLVGRTADGSAIGVDMAALAESVRTVVSGAPRQPPATPRNLTVRITR